MSKDAAPLTKPLATYAHIRKAGDVYFVAGQGCRDPKTGIYQGIRKNAQGQIESHDIRLQARGVLSNIELALASMGLNRRHIVDVNVFLKDMADFPGMNEVWNEFFADVPPPARTTVCVKDLPGENFVEMKAVASLL